MKKLFFLLILLALLAVPASAANYTLTNYPLYEKTNTNFLSVQNVSFDARELNQRIALIQFTIPSGYTVNFTLFYGSDSVVSGYAKNQITAVFPFLTTTASVALGGDVHHYTYIDTQPYYDFNLAGYAKDSTVDPQITGFLVYSLNYGALDNDLAAFYPVGNIGANTIYRIDAFCPSSFDMFITTGSPQDVSEGASKGVLDVAREWIDLAIGMGVFVYDFVVSLFYWLKFFFVDNLVLTVALYLTVSMAYAANSARDIFDFYKRFFRFQRTFFEFILGLWNILVAIISAFRGIFRI